MTRGISVRVSGNGPSSVTVHGLIDALWERCAPLLWRVEDAEVNGHDRGPEGQARLDALIHERRGVGAQELVDTLRAVGQLVEGELVGVDSTGRQILRITIVDGASVDVESEEEALLSLIEARFSRAARFSDEEMPGPRRA